MGETKPIPVRLGDEMITRLDAAAKRIGNNRAGVIRFLVDTWLADFEERGTSSLPPNWEHMLASLDNRTKESRSTANKNEPNPADKSTEPFPVAAGQKRLLKKASAVVRQENESKK